MQLELEDVSFEDIIVADDEFKNCRSFLTEIDDLAESIKENGLINPITLWYREEDEERELPVLISGRRRYEAIKLLKENPENDPELFSTITCTVFVGSLDAARARNLEENIQRSSLNPADEAIAVTELYERIENQEEVARRLGKSQGWVSQRVTLTKNLVPSVLDALRKDLIKYTAAKAISKLITSAGSPNVSAQEEALEKILTKEDTPAGIATKARQTRSKGEILALLDLLKEANNELEVDVDHRLSVIQALEWSLKRIDDEDMFFPRVATEEAVEAPQDTVEPSVEITIEDEVEAAPTPKRRRIRATA
jgi:ParB/RepB/Spo0J family partition protein